MTILLHIYRALSAKMWVLGLEGKMSQTKRNHRIWMGAKPNQFGCVPTQRKPKNCEGVRSPTRKNLELQRGAKSNQTNLANQGKPKNYEGVRSHLWIGGCILPPSSDRPVPASSSQTSIVLGFETYIYIMPSEIEVAPPKAISRDWMDISIEYIWDCSFSKSTPGAVLILERSIVMSSVHTF